MVERVRIALGQLTVGLNADDLQKLIGSELDCDPGDLTLNLVVGNGAVAVDQKLLNNIIWANHWYQRLKTEITRNRQSAGRSHPSLRTRPQALIVVPLPEAFCVCADQPHPQPTETTQLIHRVFGVVGFVSVESGEKPSLAVF